MTDRKTVQIEAPDAWSARSHGHDGPATVLLAYAQGWALAHFDEDELRESERQELADHVALGMAKVIEDCQHQVALAVGTATTEFLAKNPEAKKAHRQLI